MPALLLAPYEHGLASVRRISGSRAIPGWMREGPPNLSVDGPYEGRDRRAACLDDTLATNRSGAGSRTHSRACRLAGFFERAASRTLAVRTKIACPLAAECPNTVRSRPHRNPLHAPAGLGVVDEEATVAVIGDHRAASTGQDRHVVRLPGEVDAVHHPDGADADHKDRARAVVGDPVEAAVRREVQVMGLLAERDRLDQAARVARRRAGRRSSPSPTASRWGRTRCRAGSRRYRRTERAGAGEQVDDREVVAPLQRDPGVPLFRIDREIVGICPQQDPPTERAVEHHQLDPLSCLVRDDDHVPGDLDVVRRTTEVDEPPLAIADDHDPVRRPQCGDDGSVRRDGDVVRPAASRPDATEDAAVETHLRELAFTLQRDPDRSPGPADGGRGETAPTRFAVITPFEAITNVSGTPKTP